MHLAGDARALGGLGLGDASLLLALGGVGALAQGGHEVALRRPWRSRRRRRCPTTRTPNRSDGPHGEVVLARVEPLLDDAGRDVERERRGPGSRQRWRARGSPTAQRRRTGAARRHERERRAVSDGDRPGPAVPLPDERRSETRPSSGSPTRNQAMIGSSSTLASAMAIAMTPQATRLMRQRQRVAPHASRGGRGSGAEVSGMSASLGSDGREPRQSADCARRRGRHTKVVCRSGPATDVRAPARGPDWST